MADALGRLPGSAAPPPRAPSHLSPQMRRWWREVVSMYVLEPHHQRLLEMAGSAWDRATEARLRVEADGAYQVDRFDQLKPHPGIAVERDARVSFARLVRELGLSLETPDAPRPPSRWRS